jgi:hypothetical protein
MSEEFPTLRGFENLLQQRVAQKSAIEGPLPPAGTIDPYQLLLQRKKGEIKEIDPATIQEWPSEDVKELEDYCRRNGVVGVSSRLNPKLALMQLKRQVGDYGGVPLEERMPEGYEKIGTPNKYGPNYPYSDAISKKQIIHG